jgi:hypothetical protein
VPVRVYPMVRATAVTDFDACHNLRAADFETFLVLGIAMTTPCEIRTRTYKGPTKVLEPVTGKE